jgi:polysaccharide biosynthesis protein PelF
MKIAMMTEGTYPFSFGGVSVWCDQLIRGMTGYEFQLVAIAATEAEQVVWSLPDNVTAVHKVLLWGRSPAGPAGRRHALPTRMLRGFIDVVLDPSAQARFADTLRELFEFSLYGNLSAGLASEKAVQYLSEAWRDRRSGAGQSAPTLHDAVTALQLLEHCLRPLSYSPIQADIGHAVTNGLGVLPALAAKWQYGTPLLLTEHGIYLREQYLGNRKSPYRWPVKAFYLGFMRHLCALGYSEAAMITPGNVYNRRWEERLGAEPTHIRTVYNGVEPDNFPALEGEPEVPTISWVGRVDPIKDLETLLRAFSLVHREMPEARLRMFGAPPKGRESYLQRCRALATELGISDVATFEGRVENIRDAYEAGRVVALSSVSEGFPYSVIEAMTCGRTCVATDVGGVTEAVGDTGLVVPPRSPAPMAQAFLTLLRDDELRHRLGAAARTRALERFTVDGAISSFDEIYSFIGAGRRVPVAAPEPDAHDQPEADDESDLPPWEAPDDREHHVDAARSAVWPAGTRSPAANGGKHRRGFQAARSGAALRAVRGGVRIRSRSAGNN